VPDLLETLPGTRLEVGDCLLTLGAGTVKSLSQETTLFARYLVAGPTPDAGEQAFLDATVHALAAIGIVVRKALCGKTATLATPQGTILARSLLLADLTSAESLRLQQQGLGPHRLLGCGIFIPHKGIDAVITT
jgi:CRISPR-associated protein Cas6